MSTGREDPHLGRVRHRDGVARRVATGARSRGDGFRPGRLPADVDAASGARDPGALALRRGERARGCRPRGDRQRTLARQPGSRGRARPPPALHQHARARGRGVPARAALAGRGRNARQDHDHEPAGVPARSGLSRPVVPGRRRAARLRAELQAGLGPSLRDRGRRVRLGLLRQAAEVRPLPADDGRRRQPRVRPRRHLPGPRGGEDGLRPAAAGDPVERAPRRGQREPGARRDPEAGALPRGDVRAGCGRRLARGGRARAGPRLALPARGPRPRPGRVRSAARGRAQREERARGARRRGTGGRGASGAARAARSLPRREAPARGARLGSRDHGLRRLRPPPDRGRGDAPGAARGGRCGAARGRLRAALVHVSHAGVPGRLRAGVRGRRPRLRGGRPPAGEGPRGEAALGGGARRFDPGGRR